MESPVIVALGILGLIALVGVSAILKYKTVEEALKIWGVLSGLMGVVTGAFVTFFFTNTQIQSANNLALEESEKANIALQEIARLDYQLENFREVASSLNEGDSWTELRSEVSNLASFQFNLDTSNTPENIDNINRLEILPEREIENIPQPRELPAF